MPTYVVERNIPGLGKRTAEDLKAISRKSCEVVSGLGVPYTWIESYVTDDKMYCVHEAPSAEVVREHAQKGGFPIDRISEIKTTIGPSTAE